VKKSDLPGWNNVAVWKDFRPSYISDTIWAEYIQHVTSVRFMQWYSPMWGTGAGKFMVSLLRTPAAPFCFLVCDADCKIFFSVTSFFKFFINIFNWQYIFFAGYDSWTWTKPNGAFCENARAKWWPPKSGATVHG
jgi:hypothetical protein